MSISNHVQMPTVGGQIYQLNVNLNDPEALKSVVQAGKGDGLDQVYVHDPKTNKSYVVQKDGMDFSKAMRKGKMPVATIPINGKDVEVDIKAIDNEVNTAGEGFRSLVSIGGTVLGLGTSTYALTTAINLGPAIEKASFGRSLHMIGKQGNMRTLALGGIAAAGLAVMGSTAYGALRPQNEESLKAFIQGADLGVKTR